MEGSESECSEAKASSWTRKVKLSSFNRSIEGGTNLKAKSIITSALDMNEYFRVSNCKNAKEMWDTLLVIKSSVNASNILKNLLAFYVLL